MMKTKTPIIEESSMNLIRRTRFLILITAVAAWLMLIACSNNDEASSVVVEPPGDPAQSSEQAATTEPDVTVEATASSDGGSDDPAEAYTLTLNILLTETGFDPPEIFVPAGREVQIVLRSRSRTELHYKVEGLTPSDVLWLSTPEDEAEREEGVSDDDHDFHHSSEFVPWRAESNAGIKPTGDEVHGYTWLGTRDVVRFIAPDIGTYSIVDPLHPEFSGQITVY